MRWTVRTVTLRPILAAVLAVGGVIAVATHAHAQAGPWGAGAAEGRAPATTRT